MKLIIRVGENEVVPAWYGVAWFDFIRWGAVATPLPLVPFFIVGRWLWSALRTASTDVARDPRTAYLDGYEAGFRFARKYPPKPGHGYHLRAGKRYRVMEDSPE